MLHQQREPHSAHHQRRAQSPDAAYRRRRRQLREPRQRRRKRSCKSARFREHKLSTRAEAALRPFAAGAVRSHRHHNGSVSAWARPRHRARKHLAMPKRPWAGTLLRIGSIRISRCRAEGRARRLRPPPRRQAPAKKLPLRRKLRPRALVRAARLSSRCHRRHLQSPLPRAPERRSVIN